MPTWRNWPTRRKTMRESARLTATPSPGDTALRRGLTAALVAAFLLPGPVGTARAAGFPRLVYVARQPAAHGRLMVRDTAGRRHPLLARAPFHDVSHPVVSWDGTRIVFAAQGGFDPRRVQSPAQGAPDD